MPTVADLKRVHRATWAGGNHAAVAEMIDEAPSQDLIAKADVRRGQEVLDVATGTGNLALRAAAAHAQVVGHDLTYELFETTRRRPPRTACTSIRSKVTVSSSRRVTTQRPQSSCVYATPAGGSWSSTGPRAARSASC